MATGGYIKLYRSTLNWEWYQDANTFRVFMHLLMSANHADKKWQGITVCAGQLVTSSTSLAKALKLTRQCVRTSVKHLENTHEITTKSTNKYMLVTIANWVSYQSNERESTSTQSVKQPSTNHQLTTNKNDKKERNNILGNFDAFWAAYPKKVCKAQAEKAYQKINPSDSLLSTILEKLELQKQSAQWQKDAGQYVPHAATWLNNRRWEDEIGGEPIAQKYNCID